MTCAEMRSTRSPDGQNPQGQTLSLVLATCGPPCNPSEPNCFVSECHRWVEHEGLSLQVSDGDIEELCPVKDSPCGPGGGCTSVCPLDLQGSGPKATLRYRPGGVGRNSPGSAEWNETLGRFWSHDYAERLVFEEDSMHVDRVHAYLITADATYREFWDVNGDGVFDKTSPSDYPASLTKTLAGWELRFLDGTAKAFDAEGRWLENRDRAGIVKSGSYTAGKLAEVAFADGRRELFAYHDDGSPQNGKLASIAEVGVDGIVYRTWRYFWDGLDLVRIERPDSTAWLLRYDDPRHRGYVTRTTLRGSDATERVEQAWEYDNFGNVAKTWRGDASPTGPQSVGLESYVYEEPWNPVETRRTDPLGNLSVYKFDRDEDSNRPLPRSTSGECGSCGGGPNTQQSYDDPSNPTLVTRSIDARGTTTLFEYNANGQVVARTEAFMTDLERTTTWEYAASFPSQVTATEVPSTSGSGVRRTSWVYDDLGNATTRAEEGVENGEAFRYETVTKYNEVGLVEWTDPPGYGTADRTSFTYDPARGNQVMTARTDPLIGATTYDYDGLNRRTRVTDVNGVATETTYDLLDRVLTVTQKGATEEEDLVTTYTYTAFGELHRTILPKGNLVEYGYDAVGRLVSMERKPDVVTHGERVSYVLNGAGQRIREERQGWNGSGWQAEFFVDFVYTSPCNLDKVVHADGSVTEYAYDCVGNLEQEWDANHPSDDRKNLATKIYSYDLLGRANAITQPWSGAGGGFVVTQRQYDAQDHLTQVVDGNGTVTRYVYSDRDLLTQEVSEISGTTIFSYDGRGQQLQRSDARGITVAQSFDALGRIVRVDYPEDSLDISYAYGTTPQTFSRGRLMSITRDGESIEYGHDRFGQLLQDGALSYGYDKNGNRSTVTYPGGVSATYTYDFADRQSSLSAQEGTEPLQPIVSAASYKPSGPLTSLTLGNGLVETRRFNGRYFPESIQVPEILSWTYSTDAQGNVLGIVDNLAPESNRSYGYQDYHYYLTEGIGPWGSLGWSYDKLGNRLTETRDGNTTTYNYRPNVAEKNSAQLISTLDDTDGARPARFRYDKAGALTHQARQRSKTRHKYNAESRLAQILSDGADGTSSRTVLRYDGRSFLSQSTLTPSLRPGTRDWKTHATYNTGGVLYHRSIERHVTAQSPRGTPSVAGDDYVFYFAGRPVAQFSKRRDTASDGEDAKSFTFLTTGHLGAPILGTRENSSTLWKGGFQPFGGDYSDGLSVGIFLRLPGQWSDETWSGSNRDLDAHYNVYRWYEWSKGKYTRPDPLGIADSLNLFAYAHGRPMAMRDRLGLDADSVPFGGVLCQLPHQSGARSMKFPEPRNNCLNCDRQATQTALAHVTRQINKYCLDLDNSARPYGDREASRKTGGLYLNTDSPSGPWVAPWIIPEGNPCIDYCKCIHEATHARLARDQLSGNATYTMYYHECEAYLDQVVCLMSYQ